jgi:hypothetical protein
MSRFHLLFVSAVFVAGMQPLAQQGSPARDNRSRGPTRRSRRRWC